MTLHYKTPEERAAHDREGARIRKERWRERQAEKAREREAHYAALEAANKRLARENEQLAAENAWLRQALSGERNAPPREVIVEKTVIEKVPTIVHPINIAGVMKLVIEADIVWRGNLWPEQEPYMRPLIRCPKCGDNQGPFIK